MFCLSLAMLTGLTGCTKSQVNNDVEDNTNLKIIILNRGYGTEWVKEMAKTYMADHEGVNVTIESSDSTDYITQTLNSGKKYNDYDLYFDVSELQSAALQSTYASKDGGLLSLDELYNTTVPGEAVKYGEKMNATVRNELNVNGHYYTTSWAQSTLGIYYNKTVLDKVLGTYEIPRTSKELTDLGKSFVSKGNANKYLLFIKNLDLVSRTMFLGWWAQYEGIESYENFTQGRYVDDMTGQTYGNDVRIYAQQGRLEALKAIEPLTRLDGNKLGYQYAATTQSTYFKSIQTQFYNPNENFALYPCGDWLIEESGTDSQSNVKMMKLPVISSIIDVLPKHSIADDATLSAVVKAIDEGETSYAGVDAEDFSRVKEARLVSPSMANFHVSFIPAYANARKLAVDFLLQMATDKYIDIYKKKVNGGFLPFNYSYNDSDLSEAEKSVYEVSNNASFIFYSKKSPLFYLGNALYYSLAQASGYTIEESLNVGSSTKKIYQTAEQYYQAFLTFYEGDNWQNKVLSKLS